ncbi:MAG TPA: ribose-5-phosphate isomerase RpiA [Tepidisphaeraceae bacterium]|jgi:ribose 5-phosphate isomerase A|nr:ribose-5-phosphate isomerase RpiA [Tepidisphaeraceae bacterium]
MNAKHRAAEAALTYVTSDSVIGIGTGSTADYFIRALGDALQAERLRNVRGVPTSLSSERLARHLGIGIVSLSEYPQLDIAVDGADEIDPHLDMIKGLGGALLREKIVAQSAARMIVIADEGKLVPTLGTKSPLPVEVAAFSHEIHVGHLRQLGGEPTLRRSDDGTIFTTDNGNYIYDCKFPRIDRPRELELAIRARAGVIDTGLFLGIATVAIIGSETGVRQIQRT